MMSSVPSGPAGQQQQHSQQQQQQQQPYMNGPPPHHGTPRRDYQGYAPSPQQMHPQAYMPYHAQAYYPQHQYHNPYQPQPRWHPQQHYAPAPYAPQAMAMPQYPPRSPMMHSSPHRPTPMQQHSYNSSHGQSAHQSPRPVSQYMHYHAPNVLETPPSSSTYPATLATAESALAPATPEVPYDHSEDKVAETVKDVASAEQKKAINFGPAALDTEARQASRKPLPWYFPAGESKSTFPKAAVSRRRRGKARRAADAAVALSINEESTQAHKEATNASQLPSTTTRHESTDTLATPERFVEDPHSETSTIAAPSEPETPATSHAPSETEFPAGSTPTAHVVASATSPKAVTSQQHARRDTRSAIAVPNFPTPAKAKPSSGAAAAAAAAPPVEPTDNDRSTKTDEQTPAPTDGDDAVSQASTAPASVPVAKSWADLVRRNAKQSGAGAGGALTTGDVITNGFHASKSASLAEALKQYNVRDDAQLSFLEPRGLVNTGNMCYMNSILQVLVFCAPFYSFLDQVRQRTVHSLKSPTPLVDAMILFMREFKVLATADSAASLRQNLKQDQLEVYGEPVTPEYVYEVIRTLPRFAGMRRGHQQDAEEFLGFLLEGLHDECAHVMQGQSSANATSQDSAAAAAAAEADSSSLATPAGDGWQEVGPKQKAALTRSEGQQEAPSPITKIFGGHFRSELRVPGLQTSAVYEPFKPLQLDIGAPDVHNIVDALKGLTRIESLDGQFGGRANNTAKKQVFIHDLPPVLILHLKRFQYDNTFTGTQKIWKKVGYPLELEIPRDVFAPAERKSLAAKGGLPRYRLIGVVYHHGKSAAGGHYTVDVLRQDGREWVRMDDTFIRRVRPADVAEAGAEEDPKVLARALEQHHADQELLKQQQQQQQRNPYQGLDDDDKPEEEDRPWSEANGSGQAKKLMNTSGTTAAASNGTATPINNGAGAGKNSNATPRKENVRDNKVAYILLYERIRS